MEKHIIKTNGGLGDAFYWLPILNWLENNTNKRITLATNYPELFQDFYIRLVPHDTQIPRMTKISCLRGRFIAGTTQWEDLLQYANKILGVPANLNYEYDWKVKNHKLVSTIKSTKPIILISSPHIAFGGGNTRGHLMPFNIDIIRQVLEAFHGDLTYVLIGKEKNHHQIPVDIDLTGQTSPSDIIDVATVCGGMFGQIGWILPLAEVLNKPAMIYFSSKGQKSTDRFISSVQYAKLVHKKDIVFKINDDDIFEVGVKIFKRFLRRTK